MIFKDTAQRVRFAFNFNSLPRDSAALPSRVMMSMREAQVHQTDAAVAATMPYFYSDDARAVLDEVLALQQHEQAALVATCSHDWENRRIACDQLRDHYRPILSRIIDDRHLLSKLVIRHYIAERERGSSWSLNSISHEFNVEAERIKRAADLIDQHAKSLERAALQSLEARMVKMEHPA